MALLINYSFNNIETAQLPGALAAIYGAPTVGFGDGPQGINTLHTNGAGGSGSFGWLPNIAITGSTGLIVGAGQNVTSFGSGQTQLMHVGSSSSLNALVLAVNADGSMALYIIDGTNSFTSASGVFTFGSRHEVEIKVTEFNSSGTVTVYLDGVAVSTLTNVQPRNISGTILALNDGSTIHSVGIGGGLQGGLSSTLIVNDSFYAMDTTGSFCNAPVGPAISVPMFPDGVGQDSAWTPVGATPGWNCIHEVPPDGDATYISSATANQEEACTLSAATGISGVYGVSIIADQRQDTSGGGRTTEIGIGNGTTRSYGTAWGLGTSYVMNTTPFSSNPFTAAAWALADLSTLQIAAKLTT